MENAKLALRIYKWLCSVDPWNTDSDSLLSTLLLLKEKPQAIANEIATIIADFGLDGFFPWEKEGKQLITILQAE